MERLYQTTEQRQLIVDWLNSNTTVHLALLYALSQSTISIIKRNLDKDYTTLMKQRVWKAVAEWKRSSGKDDMEQLEFLGMPPTRESILKELINKELEVAGEDKLERIYKAILQA
jgi:hypothetical protein